MFKENKFQSLVIAFSGFPIVGRVQVEQGHRFRRAPDIHRVGLESLDSQGSRLLRPIDIDLNSEPMDSYIWKQMTECHTIAYARIESGEFVWKVQPMFEAFCFGNGKWEEAKLCLAVWSHGVDLGRLRVREVGKHCELLAHQNR